MHLFAQNWQKDFISKVVQQKQSEAKNTDPGFVGESRVPAEESPEDAWPVVGTPVLRLREAAHAIYRHKPQTCTMEADNLP